MSSAITRINVCYTVRSDVLSLCVNLLNEITLSFVDRSTQTFFIQRGSGCRFSRAFPIFDMSICSGDQSRKLSKIVKFWTIFALTNFLGRAFQNLNPFYHPCLAARRLKKFREDNPTRPEVIDSNKLSFRPNFKLSRLKF